MGLTATYERSDQRHTLLPLLVGDPVYSIASKNSPGKHLSPYTYEKVSVELTPDEQRTYDAEMSDLSRTILSKTNCPKKRRLTFKGS